VIATTLRHNRVLAGAEHRYSWGARCSIGCMCLALVALASLLSYSLLGLDYGAKPLPSALAISASLATQFVCCRYFGLPHVDLRSPLLTGFSLRLLLRESAMFSKSIDLPVQVLPTM